MSMSTQNKNLNSHFGVLAFIAKYCLRTWFRNKSAFVTIAFLIVIATVSFAQPTTTWLPTTGQAAWNNAVNWSNGIPDATKIAIFNQGNAGCYLNNTGSSTTLTVAGLVMAGYTGVFDFNSSATATNTLQVLGAANLTSGSMISSLMNVSTSAYLVISSNSSVIINGLTTSSTVSISVTINTSGVGVTLGSPATSAFNGPVSVTALDNITISGAKFYNAVTINKTGNTNWTIDGAATNLFTGSATNITIRNNGTGDFTYLNDTFDKPLILENNSSGRLIVDLITTTLEHNASATNNGVGTLRIERATFNKHLTLIQNSGSLNAGYSGNCKLAGNLTITGTVSFGNGLMSSGAMEFIGSSPQTVTSPGALSFSKIYLNKTGPVTVAMTRDIDVTVSARLENGIITMGSNTITLATNSTLDTYTANSFVDGLVRYGSTSVGNVTFPTGSVAGLLCRPLILTFAEALSNISARYFRNGPASTAVLAPLTNVSKFEQWEVNASPSVGFIASLPWRNSDTGNSTYVTDTDNLRVARLNGAQWENCGGQTDGGSVSDFALFAPVVRPQGGVVTSSSISTGGGNIGNLTLGSWNAATNSLARNYLTCRWRATVNSQWNIAGNWDNGIVPDGDDVAVFDLVNTTCILSANVIVGGIETFYPYTGSIDLAGQSLTVNAIAPVILNSGNFMGVAGSSLTVNGGVFPVDVRGVSALSTAAVTISGNTVTMGSSTLSGTVTLPSGSNIEVTEDLTIGRIVYSANMDLNGFAMTINGNGVTNTFTNGSITNSLWTTTVSILNTTSGGTTISGTSFGAGIDLNINTSASTTTTISGAANFIGPVTVQSGNVSLNGATFNVASFTKTSGVANTSNGGNVFNGNVNLTNTGGATWTMSSTTQDTFNQDLTLTEAIANTMMGCTNCKLAGNLSWNRVPTSFVAFNLGTVEFIGSSGQEIRKNGTGNPVFAAIVLNKTGGATVTDRTGLITASNITFVNGILAGTIRLGGYTGGSSVSYLDGRVSCTGTGAFTFPVGEAGSYRPITISPDASGFGVAYSKSTPPNVTSVSGANNVSLCEYWDLIYVDDTPNFSLTLSWVSDECTTPATNYVSNLADLRVMYQNDNWGSPTGWTDKGNTARTGTIAAGTVTSNVMSFNTCNGCYWNGYFTLGSETGVNILPIELSSFSGEVTTEGNVLLTWKTATELNNDHFEIQRSKEGLEFTTIGEVEGHGTSREPNSYSWIDTEPFSGRSYYRLKQIDYDGQFSYSDLISIHNNKEGRRFYVYPVPADGNQMLHLSVRSDVKVIDLMGNTILTAHDVDEISLEGFEPGLYVIQIPSGEMCRFVVK